MPLRPFTTARLGEAPADMLLAGAYRPELDNELRLLPEHLQVELAYVVMLAETRILGAAAAGALLGELRSLRAAGAARLETDAAFGPLLLQVERHLAQRIGADTAGSLNTGRSRLDQVSTVDRLFARDRLLQVIDQALRFGGTLLQRAADEAGTVMPGYVHLQHAQPMTLGHYLMRVFFTLERDLQRLQGAFGRTNLCPLGGGGGAGSSWPLDRQRVAGLLGMDGLVLNSQDCIVAAQDYPIENAAALAILMGTLGRLASDLYIWTTWEFDMVELADGLCGSSTLMPQKKNPTSLEAVRGWSANAHGWMAATLGATKSSTGTDQDVHIAGDRTGDASETCLRALDMMNAVVSTLIIKREKMATRAGANWATASQLADVLVRQAGLPWRTAHQVVARMVRLARQQGIAPAQATPALLDQAAAEIAGRPVGLAPADLSRALDPTVFLASRVTPGSAEPQEVRRQAARGQELLAAHQQWFEATSGRVERAAAELAAAVASRVQTGGAPDGADGE